MQHAGGDEEPVSRPQGLRFAAYRTRKHAAFHIAGLRMGMAMHIADRARLEGHPYQHQPAVVTEYLPANAGPGGFPADVGSGLK